MSLSDSTTLARRYIFAPGTIIPAGGYLILLCDGNLPASATNSGFGLKKTGGTVYLYDKLANGGSLMNSILYGIQAPDFAIGRVPNGGSNWVLTLPTRGGANIAASLGVAANLRINEWMAAPASGEDWLEIFNPNAQPVAIGGHRPGSLVPTAKNNAWSKPARIYCVSVEFIPKLLTAARLHGLEKPAPANTCS